VDTLICRGTVPPVITDRDTRSGSLQRAEINHRETRRKLMAATAEKALKKDVTRALAAKLAVTLSHADTIVDNFVAVLQETIKTQDLQLAGLGSFKQVVRAARQGRNPRTGQPITIPSKTVVKFKAAKEIRDSFVTARKLKPSARKREVPQQSPSKKFGSKAKRK
jgi:DNA-binding protein HU-beta